MISIAIKNIYRPIHSSPQTSSWNKKLNLDCTTKEIRRKPQTLKIVYSLTQGPPLFWSDVRLFSQSSPVLFPLSPVCRYPWLPPRTCPSTPPGPHALVCPPPPAWRAPCACGKATGPVSSRRSGIQVPTSRGWRCSSHSGSPRELSGVQRVQHKLGLTRDEEKQGDSHGNKTGQLPMYPTVPTRPRIVSPSGIWTARPRSEIRMWPAQERKRD